MVNTVLITEVHLLDNFVYVFFLLANTLHKSFILHMRGGVGKILHLHLIYYDISGYNIFGIFLHVRMNLCLWFYVDKQCFLFQESSFSMEFGGFQ